MAGTQWGGRTCLRLPRYITQHPRPGLVLSKLKLVLWKAQGSLRSAGAELQAEWSVVPWGMVWAPDGHALCSDALAGVFVTGEGHASFPGLRAGTWDSVSILLGDLSASVLWILFMSLWTVMFCNSFKPL